MKNHGLLTLGTVGSLTMGGGIVEHVNTSGISFVLMVGINQDYLL